MGRPLFSPSRLSISLRHNNSDELYLQATYFYVMTFLHGFFCIIYFLQSLNHFAD